MKKKCALWGVLPIVIAVLLVVRPANAGLTFTSISGKAATAGGEVVTLTGTGFTAVSASPSLATFGNCQAYTVSSDTEITCTIPPGHGQGIAITITNSTGDTVSLSSFSYKIPTVATVTASTTAGQRTTLTIEGSNFGLETNPTPLTNWYGLVTYSGIATEQCGNTVQLTTTKVHCVTPQHQGNSSTVLFSADGPTAATGVSFLHAEATVTQVTSTYTAGGLITLYGAEFGLSIGDVENIYTQRHSSSGVSQKCNSITQLSATAIQCIAQSGAGTGLSVQLQYRGGNFGSVISNVFSYKDPTITSIARGNTNGGTITLFGNSFGYQASDITDVHINGTRCEPTSFISVGAVSCVVHAGVGTGYNASLSIMGVQNTTAALYSYKTPTVSTATSLATAGGVIYVTGTNFGSAAHAAAASFSINVNGQNCTSAEYLTDHTLMKCTLPAGSGKGYSVLVTVDGQISDGNTAFSYKGPTVTKLNPYFVPSVGNANITIHGYNFGLPSDTLVNPTFVSSITVGDSFTPCQNMYALSYTEYVCSAPTNDIYPLPRDELVQVTVSGQSSLNVTEAWMRYKDTAKVYLRVGNHTHGTVYPYMSEAFARDTDFYIVAEVGFGVDMSPLQFASNETMASQEKRFKAGFITDGSETHGFANEILPYVSYAGNTIIYEDSVNNSRIAIFVESSKSRHFDVFKTEFVNVTIPAIFLEQQDDIELGEVFYFYTERSAHVINSFVNATNRMLRVDNTTLDIFLVNTTWVAAGATFDAVRQSILDGIVANVNQPVSTDWNQLYKPTMLSVSSVTRVSDSLVQITLPQLDSYFITGDENLTVTIPAAATTFGQPIIAYDYSPSDRNVTIKHLVEVIFEGGSILNRTRSHSVDIVNGGATVGIKLWGVKWKSGASWTSTVALSVLQGFSGSSSESTAWNSKVNPVFTSVNIERIDDFYALVTLPPAAGYALSDTFSEYISITLPTGSVTCDAPSLSRLSCATHPANWTIELTNVNDPLRIRTAVEIYVNGSTSRPTGMVPWSDVIQANITANGRAAKRLNCSSYDQQEIKGYGFNHTHASWSEFISATDSEVLTAWQTTVNEAMQSTRNYTFSRSDLSEVFNTTVQSVEYLHWQTITASSKSFTAPMFVGGCQNLGGMNDMFRVIDSSMSERGTGFFTERQKILDGWEVEFDFALTEQAKSCLAAYHNVYEYEKYKVCNDIGGEGFAFVFQNTSMDYYIPAAGTNSSGIGYEGMVWSLAVEFDIFNNHNHMDVPVSHISVHKGNGTFPNSADHSHSLGFTYLNEGISVNTTHKARIRYDKGWSPQSQILTHRMGATTVLAEELHDSVTGTLSIYLDETFDLLPRLIIPVNFDRWFPFDEGYAYIGFTSATGGFWQSVDILSFKFTATSYL